MRDMYAYSSYVFLIVLLTFVVYVGNYVASAFTKKLVFPMVSLLFCGAACFHVLLVSLTVLSLSFLCGSCCVPLILTFSFLILWVELGSFVCFSSVV